MEQKKGRDSHVLVVRISFEKAGVHPRQGHLINIFYSMLLVPWKFLVHASVSIVFPIILSSPHSSTYLLWFTNAFSFSHTRFLIPSPPSQFSSTFTMFTNIFSVIFYYHILHTLSLSHALSTSTLFFQLFTAEEV